MKTKSFFLNLLKLVSIVLITISGICCSWPAGVHIWNTFMDTIPVSSSLWGGFLMHIFWLVLILLILLFGLLCLGIFGIALVAIFTGFQHKDWWLLKMLFWKWQP